MSWLLFTLTLIGLAFITIHLPWVKKSFLQKPFILFAFLLKVICGSGLVLVYTYYYTDRSSADIYKFFDDASVIAEALPNDPSSYFKLLLGFDESDPQLINYTSRMKNWNPQSSEWLEFTQTQDYNIFQSNRIITRINAALMPLSLGNIFIHVLYFSWLSLIFSIAFLNLFSSINHSALVLISVFTLLFPSILVWCSAPLKDTLTLAASSVLLVCMNSLSAKEQRFNLIQILLAFLSVMVIIYTKYYVLIALVPAIILLFLNHQQDKQRKRISIAVFACSIISFVLFAPYISSRIDPVSILNNKREEALNSLIKSISLDCFLSKYQRLFV